MSLIKSKKFINKLKLLGINIYGNSLVFTRWLGWPDSNDYQYSRFIISAPLAPRNTNTPENFFYYEDIFAHNKTSTYFVEFLYDDGAKVFNITDFNDIYTLEKYISLDNLIKLNVVNVRLEFKK